MAKITSFNINSTTSDFNVNGGITISGKYNTNGGGSVENFDNIYMQVKEGSGAPVNLSGTFTFNAADKSYTFVSDPGQLSAANLVNGDQIKFLFRDDKDEDGDVTLTTSSTITLCFYPGTMIATPNGDAAVEELSIGDMVLRQDGTAAPIRWMGRNTISMLFADKMKAVPVRIKKGALAENVPSRDLLLSPDHAVLVGDILVQAGALVNGTSILRETNVPSKFVYYHIELADHALVMAENTPSETFIDNVDRMAFDNWAEHEALYGDEAPLVEMDLPRAKSQRQVPASVRQRLADRAAELGYAAVTTAVA